MDELDNWYKRKLGQALREAERSVLSNELQNIFGYHLLMIGAVDDELLQTSRIHHCVIMRSLSQVHCPDNPSVFSNAAQWPLATDSVDAIVFNHSLDFSADPHQSLREAERVLVAEGHILILGFNPRSLWGLTRAISINSQHVPWNGKFRSVTRIKDWLRLLGFEIVITKYMFHRPPIQHQGILKKFMVFDTMMKKLLPFWGGVYMVIGRKKVSTITPIKPRWRTRRKLVTGVVDTASKSRN